jgi:hypothetical protein
VLGLATILLAVVGTGCGERFIGHAVANETSEEVLVLEYGIWLNARVPAGTRRNMDLFVSFARPGQDSGIVTIVAIGNSGRIVSCERLTVSELEKLGTYVVREGVKRNCDLPVGTIPR